MVEDFGTVIPGPGAYNEVRLTGVGLAMSRGFVEGSAHLILVIWKAYYLSFEHSSSTLT